MESYIVRVYRRCEKNGKGVVGIVEEVGKDAKLAFTNLQELWDILATEEKGTVRNDAGKSSKTSDNAAKE